MNIITNESLVRRNARIGQFAMLGGLLVLAGGMFISFQRPDLFGVTITALLIGFILSQVGIYFSNRWGRSPRPDEIIDQSLKGLDNKYSIYHYSSPVSHLMVGPAGVWILVPKYQRGSITYVNGRYKQKGGNLYLKIFAQEGLGRPEIDVMSEKDKLQKFFSSKLSEEKIPILNAALVFTNPKTEIDINQEETLPAATLHVTKLKDLIRKEAKANRYSQEKVNNILELLEDK